MKRLDPKRYDARHNLAAALTNHNFNAEAVLEFRELEKDFPDVEVCHYCLGLALHKTWDLVGAEKEFLLAAQMDPSDPLPHVGLAAVRETQKQYDQALAEYRRAEKLDDTSVVAHLGAGRVLFAQKNYAPAVDELKRAEELQPSRADVNDLYAQVLQASGNNDRAISEFQQAVALSPGNTAAMMELAVALEKKGDWPAAIGEYHKAALQDASEDLRTKVVRADAARPQDEYKKAQERLNLHIAALKSAGKSAEAAHLEASVRAIEAAPNLSQKIDADMQAGAAANQLRHFDEALKDYQEAVELAEKMQPHDQRLATALDHVGNEYFGRDPAAAQAAYEQELKVTEEIYRCALGKYSGAAAVLGPQCADAKRLRHRREILFSAVDVNEKVYGETSDRVAASLIGAAGVYFVQQDYAKAEPYMLRAVHIDESLYGHDGVNMMMPLATVCMLYDKWGKPDKLELYDRLLPTVLEKQFGPNSPQLATTLTSEAHALHSLGREKEAADVENRLASIRSATMSTP